MARPLLDMDICLPHIGRDLPILATLGRRVSERSMIFNPQKALLPTFCYANQSCLQPSTGTAPQIFSSALKVFAAAQCLIPEGRLPNSDVCNDNEFDFIIVGAGTAGCVVANRLSEIQDWNILLIEAGSDAPIESRIPALDNSLIQSKYDWGYWSTPDGRINQANINDSILYPRGKMIGGSSNINGMAYVKGRKADYARWYQAGNKDWHPDVVEKYFKKAESFQNQKLLKSDAIGAHYGHNGPLAINRCNTTNRNLLERIVDSYVEIGIPREDDLNSLEGSANRSGIMTVTVANGVRESHDTAYLRPIYKNRHNLKIIKNTFVTKVLINTSLKAYGVEVERNGKKMRFYARLEVILSAGSINTPILLLASGIGSKEQLESKDIACKVNLQMVGRNLHDHVLIPVTIYGNGPTKLDELTQSFDAIRYIYNRTGRLAELRETDILAFYSLTANATYPEYQTHLGIFEKNYTSKVENTFRTLLRYKEPVVQSVIDLNENHSLFWFRFVLLHPKSRGNVSLRTNKPKDPIIFLNYFLDDDDLESAVAGIKTLTNIINTEYFKSINAFVGRIKWPACDDLVLESDDYWKCICINMPATIYHPVSTCKMGPDPETSVVDSHLKVHGVEKLRIIDASVIPSLTSGNTNAPTGMVGERGADLVKQDHNKLSAV